MRISRRRLLGIGAAVAGGALVVFNQRLRMLYRHLTGRVVADVPPGPLADEVVETLTAALEPALGYAVETRHYGHYFRWRAENLATYRAVYEHFARRVDELARDAGATRFADASLEIRQAVFADALERGKLQVGERQVSYQWLIVQEAVALFARTDAWTVLGYAGWPGQVRGLEGYTRAPGN